MVLVRHARAGMDVRLSQCGRLCHSSTPTRLDQIKSNKGAWTSIQGCGVGPGGFEDKAAYLQIKPRCGNLRLCATATFRTSSIPYSLAISPTILSVCTLNGQQPTMTGEVSKENDDGHAMYHLKFDEYVPLDSEDIMRSCATPMTHSKPSSLQQTRRPPAAEILPPATSAAAALTSRHDSPSRQRAPPTPLSPTRGRFVEVKPAITQEPLSQEYGYGIIHLYRDVSEGLGDADIASMGRWIGSPEKENTLAILAVPSYMTANDFMGFVGEAQKDQVSHFRMIRTEAANRYMVLLKFRTIEAAKAFHSAFNGKAFNSMEVPSPSNCYGKLM